ncbi:MAG: hypothetical protein A4E66_00820 [Syntrophus sp. PtaB.Bin001]|nr:MAG: hypothetical protein A4E66_00820 [Syntrophus sp. PtaB.Bin001]
MKLTAQDKLQGLRRSEKYRADYQAYRNDPESLADCIIGSGEPSIPSVRLCESGRRLCAKWGLQFPLNPYENSDDIPADWYFAPARHPIRKELSTITETTGIRGAPDSETVTQVNNRLVITVDPSFPIDTLMRHVQALLERHGVGRSENHAGHRHQFNIWEAYDLFQENPSLTDVARILVSRQEGIPSETVWLDESDVKSIRRAYRKACEIINYLEKSANTRL